MLAILYREFYNGNSLTRENFGFLFQKDQSDLDFIKKVETILKEIKSQEQPVENYLLYKYEILKDYDTLQ